MTVALQPSLVFDFAPEWFADLMLATGVFTLCYSMVSALTKRGSILMSENLFSLTPELKLSPMLLSTGVGLATISLMAQFSTVGTFAVFLLGKCIEGSAVVHSIRAITSKKTWLRLKLAEKKTGKSKRKSRNRRTNINTPSSGHAQSNILSKVPSDKLFYYLLRFTILVTAVLAGVMTIITQVGDVTYNLRVIWTLFTFITGFVGLAYSYYKLNMGPSPDFSMEPTSIHIVGFLLIICSSQIYNFNLFLDLTSVIVGGVVYTASIVFGFIYRRITSV